MRALVLIHRWLGVAFCLLFAMWFASGVVMHFVPFPSLSESERVSGLPVLSTGSNRPSDTQVYDFKHFLNVARLRLIAPNSAPVFVATQGGGSIAAFDARTGSTLAVDRAHALAIASSHARARGLDATRVQFVATETHDQWSVPNGFDSHRPLQRVALNDAAHTELYVSSVTGEVVIDTTRFERAWNFAGSVAHWIYPTVLRKHWAVWDRAVWWLSLIAMTSALAGLALGVVRLKQLRSPYQGWMFWHHTLGLVCALFVLTWIFSGWLSMDHGRLFSSGEVTADERASVAGTAPFQPFDIQGPFKEIEWFSFAGQTVARVIDASGDRMLHADGQRMPWLTPAQLDTAARALGPACAQTIIAQDDAYATRSVASGAPVYRIVCGDVWYHIDGADGRLVEKLDASRRAYRWAYQALHTLDFPLLGQRESLRTALILICCGAGFAFSLTGVVISWRRLTRTIF